MREEETHVRLELVWRDNDSERRTTFLEFVTLPGHVSQRQFLEFCIETTERAKALGQQRKAGGDA